MWRTTLQILLPLCVAGTALGGEWLPPVSQRFAADQVKEQPDFRRHVMPLLGRLGCNGRACHGSFKGQGGFQLSLFGYEFSSDHAALTKGEQPRVNLKQPAQSLILQKPTLAVEHEGGKRFAANGWEYRLLERWIQDGAAGMRPDETDAVTLEVEPREMVFQSVAGSASLRIVTRWPDGAREDVTPLCRFRTNDESVAAISDSGRVTAVGRGDTHVVVFYDNAIVPVPVIVPVTDLVSAGRPEQVGPRYPKVATPTRIDELVVAKLRKVGIVPSEVCGDADFLRRVSLDLTGTLPTPPEITAFIDDRTADKRPKKVEELFQRPSYSAWWATRLGDLLGNSEENLPIGGEQGVRREKSEQWYDWLQRRLRDNMPYDQIVEGIVLAISRRPGQSEADYFAEMSAYFRNANPADFAARETMPYFWTRGRFSPPQPLRFSYAFLGVRLECAQCHKHPYDQWTKADHDSFQAFFEGVNFRYGNAGPVKEMKQKLGLTADQDSGGYKKLFANLAHQGTVIPWGEVAVPSFTRRLEQAKRKAKVSGGRVFTPKLLGGEEVLATEYEDARAPLMDWLRQPDNPYFAPTLVNRIWTDYFGMGIINPADDMNLANAPSNEPLLGYLADGFVEHGYDLRWLHREITSSRTYQLSWRPNETNQGDLRNFSRAQVRRLPAEVLYDALVQATAADASLAGLQSDPQVVRNRAIGAASGYRRPDSGYALTLFGKPARDGICDCQRSNEPSLLQTIYLRNDGEVLKLLDRKDGWLSGLVRESRDWPAARQDELVRTAYLRTFSRPPTADEAATAREHLAQTADRGAGLRDLLWALVNSKEFMLNR